MMDQEKEIQDLRQALLKAQQDIERLSRIKSDFVSTISHELRTPLTSIKESVSIMLDGIAGPLTQEQVKFLTIAKNNIERLAKLINDILDLSKLESGRIAMHKRKMDINELVRNIYSAMKPMVGQKNLEFALGPSENIEPTWFDPDRIGQVLKNLISNAIKFSKEKGYIKIFSTKERVKERDVIKITVEDNGIGIPEEEMENLFKNFSPIDTGMTRKYTGSGLGLTISKGIVELHGGDIWVVSDKDIGTKFIFTIPLYRKEEEFDFLIDEAMERARYYDYKLALIIFKIKNEKDRVENVFIEIENVIKNTVRGPEDKVTRYKDGEFIVIMAGTDRPGAMVIIKRLKEKMKIPLVFGISVYPDETSDKEYLIAKAEEELRSERNSIIPKKILLIIDDEEDLTTMLSFRLKNTGFNTVTANDGVKGIEAAVENKPDLILLDLMMPNIDGFEICKRLKSDKDTKDIPVLIFTAIKKNNLNNKIYEMGAVGFIEKPFEPGSLIEKINKILEVRNG